VTPSNATGPITLEILDASGTVVRSLSPDDPRFERDPALDPKGYDAICQQSPGAPGEPNEAMGR